MSTSLKKTALAAAVLGSLFASAVAPSAFASSHREAPFIAGQPKVDGTDFYMFNSYEPGRANYVTLVANYVPLQDAYGGPNYFAMDPNALYEIHIDSTGLNKEDLTFQFRFTNTKKNAALNIGGKQVAIPLVINGGAITSVNPPGLNVRETYSVTAVRGDRRTGTRSMVTNAAGGASVFDKPVDNIGNKAIPDYPAYAAQHVYNVNIPGCSMPAKMFVGQRKDSFVVNLGETFDLVNYSDPLGSPNRGLDDLKDKNVTSIELEVHKSCLIGTGNGNIGGWTTASLRQGRLLNPTPNLGVTSKEGGAWTQVSRLGMPLVNEVVIGLKDKDQFNHSQPKDDAQFATYVTNPTLPALIELLFPGAPAPTNFPRNDLVTAFLTGVPGLNQQATVGGSEMLRLNTNIAATPKASQNPLGVVAGDNAGFPNGRRPGDDVVDISLRVVMGKLCTLNIGCVPSDAPAGGAPFTDGAYVDADFFDASFPYLKAPLAGSPSTSR